MPDLVSVSEIAELLGVSVRTAHRLVNRNDFPAPLGETSSGRVWRLTAVERWARRPPVELGRGRGRPPKPKK
jgi:excisionase family DNA binding protein